MSRLFSLLVALLFAVSCSSTEPKDEANSPPSQPENQETDAAEKEQEQAEEEFDPYRCDTDNDCTAQGCSGQLCAAQDAGMVTTCEWRDEYACYDEEFTSCDCQNGTCGWKQTEALSQCLDDPPEGVEEPF